MAALVISGAAGALFAAYARRGGRDRAELVRAAGRLRAGEARLSGGFAHGPRAAKGAPQEPPSWALRAVAERVIARAREHPSPRAQADAGVAALVLGRLDDAVSRLESASLLAPSDPAALSDLAAAYLARGRAGDRSDDLVRALDVSERAVASSRTVEAMFNLALALEGVSLEDRALQAWDDYLEADAGSGWAEEARGHVRRLSAPSGARRWQEERGRLVAAAGAGDAATARRIVADHPEAAREALEDEWIPAWADAALARGGERPDARALLLLAEAHAERSGDPLLRDAVTLLQGDRVDGALRRGHAAYGRGRRLYEQLAFTPARAEFEAASRELSSARSPFALVAAYQAALCRHAVDEDVEPEFLRLADAARSRGYASVEGRVRWVLSRIRTLRNDLVPAREGYLAAARLFEGTGDVGASATVLGYAAEIADSFLGDFRAAWDDRRKALARLREVRNPRWQHGILRYCASGLVSAGLWHAARAFQDEEVASAERSGKPGVLAAGYVDRAVLRLRAGDAARAREDLTRARSWCVRVEEPAARRALEPEIAVAEADPLLGNDPRATVSALTGAVEILRSIGSVVRLPEALLARARALRRLGDDGAAERDLVAAIELYEGSRLGPEPGPGYWDQAGEAFDDAVAIRIAHGDPRRALELVERSRARDLLVRLGVRAAPASSRPLELPAIQRALPPDVALVFHHCGPDGAYAWTVTGGRLAFRRLAASSERILRSVSELDAGLRGGGGDDRSAAELYEMLVAPIRETLPRASRLVFIPDGALQTVPFAALLDRVHRRRLIQDFAVSYAPSASAYVAAGARRAGAAHRGVLVVAEPALDRRELADLPALPYARREGDAVGAVYGGATVLSGPAATKARFLAELERHAIVHFAGHALAREDRPELSRLLLSPDGDASGSLYARDVAARRLDGVRLVVLAGCSTARGPLSRSEGFLGVARAFLAAGVPNVVATLWNVDDRAAHDLVVAFHEEISRGAEPDRALRAAQLRFLESPDPDRRHPARWAAFRIVGASAM